jgi:hypothetical protein
VIIRITTIAVPLSMNLALLRTTGYLILKPYSATYNIAKGRQQRTKANARHTLRRPLTAGSIKQNLFNQTCLNNCVVSWLRV